MGLMWRLPKKKGGGAPQVGRGIRFDGRGGGKGLMRHSHPTAKVDPKWARKEGKGDASQGEAREEGWRDRGGERAPEAVLSQEGHL